MPKFRKRPVVIEATQITRPMVVKTLEGTMRGEPGDWLITGVQGEKYFCKPDIFAKTYEPVEPWSARRTPGLSSVAGERPHSRSH
jgi:PGDYG protein